MESNKSQMSKLFVCSAVDFKDDFEEVGTSSKLNQIRNDIHFDRDRNCNEQSETWHRLKLQKK